MKKTILAALVLTILFQGAAFALETEGEIIFRDTLYGAAIGAIIGGAIYLADDDNFGGKVGTSVAIGAIGGLLYGINETKSFVELKNDEVRIAIPTPVIEKKADRLTYSASLLKTHF